MPRVTIIGPGRLGGALAIALDGTNFAASQIVYRTRSKAEKVTTRVSSAPTLIPAGDIAIATSEVIIICVPDPEIAHICEKLVSFVKTRTVVLHASGSKSSSVLEPLRSAGCSVGSMHPLAAISDPETGSVLLRGAYFCIEGDEAAVGVAEAIAVSVGALPFTIAPEFKPLYHAAAVTASGHVVALFDAAIEMLMACELDNELSRDILRPLIFSAVANLKTHDTPHALTGPYARGDDETVERHLASFPSAVSENAVAAYLTLAERSLALAERRGIDAETAASIRNRISVAKRKLEW